MAGNLQNAARYALDARLAVYLRSKRQVFYCLMSGKNPV